MELHAPTHRLLTMSSVRPSNSGCTWIVGRAVSTRVGGILAVETDPRESRVVHLLDQNIPLKN